MPYISELPNGELIKQLRTKLGSQESVAADIGISHVSLRNYEKGRPASVENLKLVAAFFGLEKEELVRKKNDTAEVLIEQLNLRADEIRYRVREQYPGPGINTDEYIRQFDQLHEQHVLALRAGDLVLAHDLVIKIHDLSYQLGCEDASRKMRPGGDYAMLADAFEREAMVTCYMSGVYQKEHPSYPRSIRTQIGMTDAERILRYGNAFGIDVSTTTTGFDFVLSESNFDTENIAGPSYRYALNVPRELVGCRVTVKAWCIGRLDYRAWVTEAAELIAAELSSKGNFDESDLLYLCQQLLQERFEKMMGADYGKIVQSIELNPRDRG